MKVGDLVRYHPIYDRCGYGVILNIILKPGCSRDIEVCWSNGEVFTDSAHDYEIIDETH